MLGARCLASRCPALRLALPEICHRRSRRHPAFAPASQRMVGAEARSRRYQSRRLAETACLYGWKPLPNVSRSLHSHDYPTRPATCPVTLLHTRPENGRLALGRSLLHAVSRRARGQRSPPSSLHKIPWYQGLAAFRSSGLLSRRQLETAPQPAIWQAVQPRVIHFSPVCLWTEVDKSTSCRICRKGARNGERNRPQSVDLKRISGPERGATRVRRRGCGARAGASAGH